MAQRAAERAAIARLAVADLLDRLVHQRAALAHHIGEFEVALARHGADLERAVVLADVGQAIDAVEIDDMVRQHEAHVEHRHQRLPAGEQLGVLQPAEQADGVGDRARVVIGKGRRFHAGSYAFACFDLCQKAGINPIRYINPKYETSR